MKGTLRRFAISISEPVISMCTTVSCAWIQFSCANRRGCRSQKKTQGCPPYFTAVSQEERTSVYLVDVDAKHSGHLLHLLHALLLGHHVVCLMCSFLNVLDFESRVKGWMVCAADEEGSDCNFVSSNRGTTSLHATTSPGERCRGYSTAQVPRECALSLVLGSCVQF